MDNKIENMNTENNIIAEKRLPRRFRNKLIRALRSGRYVQTTGKMKEYDNDAYDVIGVAYRQAGVPKQSITKMENPTGKRYNFLPKVLCEPEGFVVNKLTGLNDKGMSFNWIAAHIEQHM